MTKKQIPFISLVMASIFILGACRMFQTETDIIQIVEEATKKNAYIENGRFESILTIESESEPIHQESSEGTFVRKGATDYDWYYKTVFQENELTSHELVEINGKQFQRTILDQQTTSEWLPAPEPGTSFKGITSSLFGHGLIETEIAKLHVQEEDDTIQYEIFLSEAYSDRMKDESRKEIQKIIDEAKDTNDEDVMIQAMETQLKHIEETNYRDSMITYVINTDGYMTAVHSKTIVLPLNEEEYTVNNHLILTEYNIENAEGLFPELE